jgi:serine/threonine protein kinase/Tfp pilus assembly protein PilF
MAIVPGTLIGRYEVRSKIGEGGMGEVYLAQDTKLDRKVALKILPAEFAANQDRMRRFVQEAKAASALNHPNILTVYEIGHAVSTHFIATEYIEGETLRAYLATAQLRLNEVLDICVQITNALATAHQAGIVHRDIKPENIMIRRDGIVKVLDFGLAKLTASDSATVDTQAPTRHLLQTDPGTVAGTVLYMSPEQARGIAVDARTDIFSLGVVLYEMVAGCLPFAGSTSSEVVASLLSEKEPQPLARYSREVPAELERIVSKGLRKNKDERYQTIKDMLLDLRTLKQELEFERKLERAVPPKSPSAADTIEQEGAETVLKSEARRTAIRVRPTSPIELNQRKAAIAVAALLIIAAGVGAYFHLTRPRNGPISSIAVLPFGNASNNPDAEYLSDGISESLINSLSQLPGLKVIARGSSFKYKGKDADPQEVANALGVEAILTGRVTQRGDNLLISVELIDARDKTQVWGEQYNRRASDLLAVQAEISREIAENLRLRLTTGDERQLARRETANTAAYELVLKGRFYTRKGGTENRKKAIEYFQQAIAVDPNYAVAYAELSVSYSALVGGSWLDPKEFTPKAEAAARRALELDESLAEAHHALARIKLNSWDWATAEREFKRTIELNPNLARAHSGYADYLSLMGRHEQAIAENKRAKELDPLSLGANVGVGAKLYFARQYDQAIEVLKKTLELDQNFALPYVFLGYTYEAKRMYPEAIAAYQQFLKLSGDDTSAQIYLGVSYAHAGQREKAQAILKRLQTTKEYVSPGELAVLYDALGEREQAFASLERAHAAHDLQLQYMAVDPAFDPLRSDPRFADLMRRVGLLQ